MEEENFNGIPRDFYSLTWKSVLTFTLKGIIIKR